jgi:aryl-alcohol dehydrogenase-like predicted oxidoreductase
MSIEGVTSVPIFGGRSLQQLEENVGAVEISLSAEQREQIASAGL